VQRRAEAAGVAPEEIEQRMKAANTIRHLVTAEEIADIVAFLASPRSIAINGDCVAAGGGMPGAIYY
jgi:enoyl-[acyl-carrier-protein] reductase (NADH)